VSFFSTVLQKISLSLKSTIYLTGLSPQTLTLSQNLQILQTSSLAKFLSPTTPLKSSTKFQKLNIFNLNFYSFIYSLLFFFEQFSRKCLFIFKTSFGEGLGLIRGLFIIFFFDALLIDDEPL
jgi:hypothetical protein